MAAFPFKHGVCHCISLRFCLLVFICCADFLTLFGALGVPICQRHVELSGRVFRFPLILLQHVLVQAPSSMFKPCCKRAQALNEKNSLAGWSHCGIVPGEAVQRNKVLVDRFTECFQLSETPTSKAAGALDLV